MESRPASSEPVSAGNWRKFRTCNGIDPEVFFKSGEKNIAVAKSYCAVCPVASFCLDYALDARIMQGVMGGKTGRERRYIISAARQAPEAGTQPS